MVDAGRERREVDQGRAAGSARAGSQGAVRLRFFGAPLAFERIGWLLAGLAFALLAFWVTSGGALWLDQAALSWLQQPRSPELDALAHILSLFGSELIGVVHIILLVVLIKRRRWELAAGLFFATAGAGFLNGLIKDLFDRTRPAEVYGLLPATAGQVYSFPSGHAMVTAAFFYFLAYVSCPLLHGWRLTGWILGVLLVALIVGLTRTYLGAHWTTDVLGGYLIGYFWAQTVIFGAHFVSRWRARASRRQDRPPACPDGDQSLAATLGD